MAATQAEKYQAFKAQDEAEIERQFLSGERDPDIGVYCNMFSAKTAFEGQDGGVVTSLLTKGFEDGDFDAAVVVRSMEGYNAEASVAHNAKDVAAASGTKYLRINVSAKLRELISQGKKRIAVVCTPCEVKSVRKIQQKLPQDCKLTVIGLFCFEAFNRAKLKQEIQSRLDVDIDEAKKTQVRQGKFIVSVGDRKLDCKVKDLDSAAEPSCNFCDDFTSQLADISVGSVGSKEGFSTVIVRSETGAAAAARLEAQKGTVNKSEVIRIAKLKRERAKKAFTNHEKPS